MISHSNFNTTYDFRWMFGILTFQIKYIYNIERERANTSELTTLGNAF